MSIGWLTACPLDSDELALPEVLGEQPTRVIIIAMDSSNNIVLFIIFTPENL
jgi:hypothetical protein